MSTWSNRSTLVTAGFVAGAVAGMLVWSYQIRRSRRALFARSPVRRLAALGHLAGQPSLENARVLAEYVRWESQPMLRKRAEVALGRMQRLLG